MYLTDRASDTLPSSLATPGDREHALVVYGTEEGPERWARGPESPPYTETSIRPTHRLRPSTCSTTSLSTSLPFSRHLPTGSRQDAALEASLEFRSERQFQQQE